MSFWIGILFMVGFAVFGLIVTGLSPLDLIDAPSIIMVVGPALVAGGMIGGFKQLIPAFLALTKEGINERESALFQRIFKAMGDVGLGSGFIGTLIAAIQMLRNIASGDAAAIGAGVATAIITVLYGLAWKYYVCVPAEARLSGNES